MSHPRSIPMLFVLILALGSRVMAQDPVYLKPLDSAVGDRGPMSMSLRDMTIDLRNPFGFQRVYQVPGDPNQMMRVDGAVHATFPTSTYTPSKRGLIADIPPGTVFWLGEPRATIFDTPSGRGRTIDDRVYAEVAAAGPSDAAPHDSRRGSVDSTNDAEARSLSIVNSAAYRQARISELLNRAATAAAAAANPVRQ